MFRIFANRPLFYSLMFLLLASCGQQQPVKVFYGDSGVRGKAVSRTVLKSSKIPFPTLKNSRANYKLLRVKKGDSVYKISKKYHLTSRDIIHANRLRAPYLLKVGQNIKIPSYRYHKVKKGDSIYKISRVYRTNMHSLAKANSMSRPYSIVPGQWLIVPGAKAKKVVAKKKIRGKKGANETLLANVISGKPKKARNISAKPKVRKKGYSSSKPSGYYKKAVYASAGGKGKFGWPVRGKIIDGFGPKKSGVYNDGINIRARDGDKVLSSEAGKVVYTGKGLKGYGNLLILKHNNGYITAYAHNRKVLVRKGERVKRGQVIAVVGATGNVDHPQLHFAIRKGKKAIDPTKFLSG